MRNHKRAPKRSTNPARIPLRKPFMSAWRRLWPPGAARRPHHHRRRRREHRPPQRRCTCSACAAARRLRGTSPRARWRPARRCHDAEAFGTKRSGRVRWRRRRGSPLVPRRSSRRHAAQVTSGRWPEMISESRSKSASRPSGRPRHAGSAGASRPHARCVARTFSSRADSDASARHRRATSRARG